MSAFSVIYILTNTVYRCWAVPFWHGRWALDRHSTMMINGCSRFMRRVKRRNHTFCLPTQYWLTGYACNKLWRHNIKLFSIGIFYFFFNPEVFEDTEGPWLWRKDCVLKWNSPGMSVRLGCWRQNEGVFGRDPGSSHVYPAEIICEVEGRN